MRNISDDSARIPCREDPVRDVASYDAARTDSPVLPFSTKNSQLPRTPETVHFASHVRTAKSLIQKLLIVVGNSLTLIGCIGLILTVTGVVSAELFGNGPSPGVREVGSIAIAGCLLSAIGYGIVDHLEN